MSKLLNKSPIPQRLLDLAIDAGYEQWADSANWKKIATDPLFFTALDIAFENLKRDHKEKTYVLFQKSIDALRDLEKGLGLSVRVETGGDDSRVIKTIIGHMKIAAANNLLGRARDALKKLLDSAFNK